MKNLDIIKVVVRDLLINEGRFHLHKNKRFKSKKTYTRKKKHRNKKSEEQ